MELSEEQEDIISNIQTTELLKIEASSGAGKTFVLLQIAKLFRGKKLYLAYNKAIADEAKEKFDPSVDVKTTHGLAWLPIVKQGASMNGIKPGSRTLDFFNWRNIIEDISYTDKLFVIDTMEKYFTSKYISLSEYLQVYVVDKSLHPVITSYVQKMAKKEIPCTFAFTLKYYHILLARGVLKATEYELLMLDEAGDLNEVTLEIFNLIPAKHKVMVGDSMQNIYSFNNTINGFKAMKDHGITKKLTTTYRCSEEIAESVQTFVRSTLDPEFKFTGLPKEDTTTINTSMYIARTNASLIVKMMELNETHVPYSLTRKASDIFGLLLTIISLKPGSKIYKQEYKYLTKDITTYYGNSNLQKQNKTLFSYIAKVHSEDISISSACRAIIKHGPKKIWDTFNIAKLHETSKVTHKLLLTTVHSAKGLESDQVILADDMYPEYLGENKRKLKQEEIDEECRLAYVACTRAKRELLNANWLTEV